MVAQPLPVPESLEARSLVAGEWRAGSSAVDVLDPFRGEVAGSVSVATVEDLNAALDAAMAAKTTMARMPGYERAAMLRRIAERVGERQDAIATVMARESGKALKDCRMEVARSLETLQLCAEESVRIEGEHIPMDSSRISAGKLAVTMRFPRGVVAAISAFNAPINLAAHKVGSALASGNAVILKPSPKAPLCVQLFAEAVLEADVPSGAVGVLHGDEISAALVSDRRTDFVSFTGSIPVGKRIRSSVGLKDVTLELGGVGPTIIAADGDVAAAATACARNGVLLAGQSCISVQNVMVHRTRYDEFLELVTAELAKLTFGDPLDESTDVGTLIDERAAQRVEEMLQRAVGEGARVATGGHRSQAQIDATLLVDVTPEMEIAREEIFGPAFSVIPFEHVQPVFDSISASPYGLQTGVFTSSLALALEAHRSIRTGGVIINGTSRWRSDQMPYGGVKDSGTGREGPKFAIRDMTEPRLLVFA